MVVILIQRSMRAWRHARKLHAPAGDIGGILDLGHHTIAFVPQGLGVDEHLRGEVVPRHAPWAAVRHARQRVHCLGEVPIFLLRLCEVRGETVAGAYLWIKNMEPLTCMTHHEETCH